MEAREDKPFPPTPVALGVLTAIVYVAGFTMIAAWFALVVMDQPRAAPAPLEAVATPPPAAAAPAASQPERTPSPGLPAARAP